MRDTKKHVLIQLYKNHVKMKTYNTCMILIPILVGPSMNLRVRWSLVIGENLRLRESPAVEESWIARENLTLAVLRPQ